MHRAARGYYSLSIMKKALILLVLHLLMYLLVYFSTVLVIACTGTMLMGALAWAGLFTYSIVLAVMLQLSGSFIFDTGTRAVTEFWQQCGIWDLLLW